MPKREYDHAQELHHAVQRCETPLHIAQTSGSFFAQTSVRSPRFFFPFHYQKNIFFGFKHIYKRFYYVFEEALAKTGWDQHQHMKLQKHNETYIGYFNPEKQLIKTII